MLDADRALEFTRAAGSALKSSFLREMLADERLFAGRTEFVQIPPHAKGNFLRIKKLARVMGGAVFRATAALNTRIGLESIKLGDVLAGVQAEVLIAGQRRNLAEFRALQENGQRTQNQVKMLSVRDQR